MSLIGTIPAIIGGAACCVPTLILVIGLQLTATLAAVWSYFVPLSAILLILSLWWSLRRIQKVNLEIASEGSVVVTEDERLNDKIVGIMRTGLGLRGFEFLGTGKVYTPENTILITNKQIIFIVIPVKGAGKLISGTDISMWQWLMSKSKLSETLNSLLKSKSLSEIVKMHQQNFSIPLGHLKVSIGSKYTQKICFSYLTKKVCYSIRDKQDFNRAKNLFNSYLIK